MSWLSAVFVSSVVSLEDKTTIVKQTISLSFEGPKKPQIQTSAEERHKNVFRRFLSPSFRRGFVFK